MRAPELYGFCVRLVLLICSLTVLINDIPFDSSAILQGGMGRGREMLQDTSGSVGVTVVERATMDVDSVGHHIKHCGVSVSERAFGQTQLRTSSQANVSFVCLATNIFVLSSQDPRSDAFR
jgi:hypothetical protein